VLAPLRRVRSDRHAIAAVAHVLRHALGSAEVERAIAAGLIEEFPWADFLPADERDRFTTGLLDVLRACAVVGRFIAFENLIDSWQATAEVWSDPELAGRLIEPVDVPHGGDVPAPSATNRLIGAEEA
jgi:hypothetical protein